MPLATHAPPAMHIPCHACSFHNAFPLCHTCPSFAMHIPLFTIHAPLWTEFLTHACENITFPQLLLLMVIITLSKSSAVTLALVIVCSILQASQHPLVRACTSIKGVWLTYFKVRILHKSCQGDTSYDVIIPQK